MRRALQTLRRGDIIYPENWRIRMKRDDISEIARDVVRPSKEECIRNSRAHSTKMRWAIKA